MWAWRRGVGLALTSRLGRSVDLFSTWNRRSDIGLAVTWSGAGDAWSWHPPETGEKKERGPFWSRREGVGLASHRAGGEARACPLLELKRKRGLGHLLDWEWRRELGSILKGEGRRGHGSFGSRGGVDFSPSWNGREGKAWVWPLLELKSKRVVGTLLTLEMRRGLGPSRAGEEA